MTVASNLDIDELKQNERAICHSLYSSAAANPINFALNFAAKRNARLAFLQQTVGKAIRKFLARGEFAIGIGRLVWFV